MAAATGAAAARVRPPVAGILSRIAPVVLCVAAGPLGGQDTRSESARPFTFRGEVRDYLSELPIPGATVQVVELRRSAVTDHNGYFELPDVLPDRYTFVTSGFGYETNREPSRVGLNAFMVVRLNPMAIPLEGIEVTVERLIQQLEVRRLSTPVASEVFERETMKRTIEPDLASFVNTRTSFTIYRDRMDRVQARLRGRPTDLRVCLDEVPVASNFMGNLHPTELGLMEVYEGLGMIRLYTNGFLTRAAKEGFSPAPVTLAGRGCQ